MITTIMFLAGVVGLSGWLVGEFHQRAEGWGLLDYPNQRSSHLTPVPRGGGVIFLIVWSFALVLLWGIGQLELFYLKIFLPSTLLIGWVGLLDDRYGLTARVRFGFQLATTLYVMMLVGSFAALDLGDGAIRWGIWGYLFAALGLLWSTNLYNFMDGSDGLASIEALFVFGLGGHFIWMAGGEGLAIASWAVAAAVLGFAVWNRPPAKVFMGDVGSTILGFLVALFAIVGEKKYHVPVLLWVILYGVFWFDATLTLVRRLLHGDRWYQAHKLHAFQRIQKQRWSHGKVLRAAVVINIILSGLAKWSYYAPHYLLWALILAVGILAVCYWIIERLQPMYPKISATNFRKF